MSTLLDEITELEQDYIRWLKDNSAIHDVDGRTVEIVTPFLDGDNDKIPLYVTRQGTQYRLTDGGETFQRLSMAGCNVQGGRVGNFIQRTATAFGLQLEDGVELTTLSTSHDFAQRKHSLVQAILEIGDMVNFSQPSFPNIFLDQVNEWLTSSQVRFLPDVNFQGKSTFVQHFHFAIPRSPNAPERIVQAVNNMTKEIAEGLMFKWSDVMAQRGDARLIALHNSTGKDFTQPLQAYGIESCSWADKDKLRAELVA